MLAAAVVDKTLTLQQRQVDLEAVELVEALR
jgi:hypothetical protein